MKKITFFICAFLMCGLSTVTAQHNFASQGPETVTNGAPVTVPINDMANTANVPAGLYDAFSVSAEWSEISGGPYSSEADLTLTTTAGSISIDPATSGSAANGLDTTLIFSGDLAGIYDPSTDGFLEIVLNQSWSGTSAEWTNIVVTLFEAPDCEVPTNVASNGGPTTTTLGIIWTLEPNATDYQTELGAPGFTPGTGTAIISGNAGNTTGVAFSGLTPDTTYDMYVRSDCSTDGFSEWVGPITDTTLATCLPPTNGSVMNVLDTSAELTWTDEPNASLGYAIELGLAGFVPDTGTGVQGGTAPQAQQVVSFPGLTVSTDYDVYIRSNCDTDGNSVWEGPFSFTTLGGPGEGCALPLAAAVEADCSTATPITIDFATAPNIGGTGTCDASGDNRGFWYEFTAPASGTVNISNSGANNEYVILDACGGTEILCGAMDATNEISGLTPAAVYKMAIWKDSFQTLSTDDFCIAEVNCSAPSALMASNITTTSADLSWTAGGSEILWDIELVDITAGDTATGTATATGVSNPYTQIGLVANNEYEYYVLADCGGSTSDWAGPFSFTTPCDSFVPDYLESFDTGVAPSCWIEAGAGDPTSGPSDLGGGLWNHDEFANIGSTNNSAQINLYTDNREDWLISPSFDLSGGSYELVYTVAVTDYANSNPPELNGMGSDDEVQVLITTDGGASWANLATYNQASYPSETGDVETFDLSTYTGTVQFAIWATDGTVDDDEDYDFFIDEFIVRTPLACVSAVVDSSDIFDDCGNSQFYVDVDITTVGDATQINDGTTTFAITGTGVLQVGPYTDGSSVTLTVEHADVACDYSLGDFTYTCPPANDLFADAIVIACGDIVSGTTIGATQDESDAPEDATVEDDTPADNDSPWVWYSFTGTGVSEIVTLSTCGTANTDFDTELFVYTGTSGSLTLIDDGYDECGGSAENYAAETSFTSDGTTTYYVAVGGWNVGSVGNFQLTISCETACTADAGTLTADATPVELDGSTTISATPNGDIVVPTDYDVTYVLTSGASLVIEQAGAAPSFDVTSTGDYTIHTLVAETTDNTDPNYLDLSVIVFGTTTGGDVLDIVSANNLCASLDVTGAPIVVEDLLSFGEFENEAAFTYYPNPVKNTLTLNAQNTIEQVAMYNMLGQEVLRAMPNSVDSDLDMSQLQTGTYFVKVTIANITETIRVIKQ